MSAIDIDIYLLLEEEKELETRERAHGTPKIVDRRQIFKSTINQCMFDSDGFCLFLVG